MPLNIRDETVNHLAAKLAALSGLTKTQAVKLALEGEIARRVQVKPLRERLRPLQDRITALPATGLEADKAFYDDLNGEP
jgi:antitoxin VapB